MRKVVLIILCCVLASALFPIVARAGGPFVVDEVNKTGVAQRWSNNTLEWKALRKHERRLM